MRDFDRPLNARGIRDAPEMGKRIGIRRWVPDTILASPAQRVRQTLKGLLPAAEISESKILWLPEIYESSANGLLRLIRTFGSGHHLWLVGHNPALHDLVEELTGEQLKKFPTCAMARLAFPGRIRPEWAEIQTGSGRLEGFDFPKRPFQE